METQRRFEYSIQSLLTEKDGSISGPMSPTLFAKEMAEQSGFKYNRLARLWFADERINQCYEDGGLTGHDTLIIGVQYSDDLMLTLWVDSGTGGTPVAMAFHSDKGMVQMTEVYAGQTYAKKLCKKEVEEIFGAVFNEPAIINIKKD
ncbi:MAG: hypothetical protein JKY70_06790 [Mucilaginibacter sp.]|nr:hypothetical protein [Mucilaginibacter sp.]